MFSDPVDLSIATPGFFPPRTQTPGQTAEWYFPAIQAVWLLVLLPVHKSGCRATGLRDWMYVVQVSRISPFDLETNRRAARRQWGQRYLRQRDNIFVKGNSRILLGLLNVSEFSANMVASDFSYVGLMSVEDSKVVVFDIVPDDLRRIRFGRYVTHADVWSLAIKRLRPEFHPIVFRTVQFGRDICTRLAWEITYLVSDRARTGSSYCRGRT